MASMFPGQVSAVQVGSYFVGQYYHVLQSAPDLAFQFYGGSSTTTRIDGDHVDTAAGQMQIHSLITTLNFTGIEIKTAHSLDSWNGGVLVMVSGFVQMKDYNGRRKFVQTFFLAPQEKGYFVLNDIFQFLDEELIPEPSATSLAYSNYECSLNASNHMQEPDSAYMLEEEIHAGEYMPPLHVPAEEIQASSYAAPAHVAESDTIGDYVVPEPQHQGFEPDDKTDEVPAEESVASLPNTMNMVRDLPPSASEEHAGERPKQTYASILRLAKGLSEISMPQVASLRKTTPVTSDAPLATPQQTYPTLSVKPEKSSSDATVEFTNTTVEDEGESLSVYVGNLPSSVSASDLEKEFKNFGRIIPDGVTVRSRKDSGGFYAFVEFEDTISVQNALKASPILLNGRQIYVEERRPNSGISRGGRGRGRGRGAYQSEASRGRFGGRSYGGGGNETNDRDYGSSRPRANGAHQLLPRQERGILGNHASRNGAY